MLTAYFYHKVTGLPLTDPGVTVSVTLANMNRDVKILDNVTMEASTSIPGAFRYLYNFDREIDYMAYYSCSDDNYGEKETQYFFPSNTGGGGGGTVNLTGVQGTIKSSYEKLVAEFDKKLEEMREEIRMEFNDTNSHIDVAKSDVIDTIEAIEIPETDISNLSDGIGILKQRFTKLDTWIKKKDDKEKSDELAEKEGEYSSLLSDIEKEYKTILSSKDEEIESLKKELEESKKKEEGYEAMVDVLEEEIQETKDKVEKETKENLIKTISTL